jgi:hypothetical protein
MMKRGMRLRTMNFSTHSGKKLIVGIPILAEVTMKIEITKDCIIDLVIGRDYDGCPIFSEYLFSAGMILEARILGFARTARTKWRKPDRNWVQLQFSDGTISMGVPVEHIKILEGQDEFKKAYKKSLNIN